jgi:hypothetical protein
MFSFHVTRLFSTYNDEGEDIHRNSSDLLEDTTMDIQHELSGSEQHVELSESFEGVPVTDQYTNEAAAPELADSELWTFLKVVLVVCLTYDRIPCSFQRLPLSISCRIISLKLINSSMKYQHKCTRVSVVLTFPLWPKINANVTICSFSPHSAWDDPLAFSLDG